MNRDADRLLVVDDERAEREALQQYLTRAGFVVDAAASGEEALGKLAEHPFGLLITDLRLPGMDGLAVIREAHERYRELGVLLITAYASVDSAIEALRLGAQDYLLKPLILEEVERKARGLLTHRRLLQENALLRQALQEASEEPEVVAVSPAMKEVMKWARRAAGVKATVLLTGETGTGKEIVARSIHRMGSFRQEPLLAVNLAAVPENMIESELFGHERGAFTGAEQRREGILRAAGKGTVFLDEVAELSPPIQAKLLRAFEAREVQPLGSDRTAPFEARIIAATHRDLTQMVAAGEFREDFYYRLNVLRLNLPPLRERPEDIPTLIRHLLRRHAATSGSPVPRVTEEAMRVLCQHPWKGNIRELSNILERTLILSEEGQGQIDVDQLPIDVRGSAETPLNLQEAVERFEKAHIALVLRLSNGNREKAAEELGISVATLYRRIEKLQLKGYEVHHEERAALPMDKPTTAQSQI